MNKYLPWKEFSWSDFIERNLFEQVLLSAIGVPVTYWLISGSEWKAEWLVLNPLLTMACFYCAFLLVWKTSIEEHETADAYETLFDYQSTCWKVWDSVFDVPYLFLVFVLPFFCATYQFFVLFLLAVYIIWMVYGWLILHAVTVYNESEGRNDWERAACPITAYFKQRQKISGFCLLVAILGALSSWYLALNGFVVPFLVVGFCSVLLIIVAENVIEPILMLNLRFYYFDKPPSERTEVIRVDRTAELDDATIKALEEIHNEAFPPEEQKLSIDSMLKEVRTSGNFLHLVWLDGVIIGYFFFEVRTSLRMAFLWYFAIKKCWRNRGIGNRVIRTMLAQLERWPTPIRYALFESRSPTVGSDHENIDRRRIEFYRRLGAHWLRGLKYRVPSHADPTVLLSYEVMLFPIADRVRRKEIGIAVMEMAKPLGEKQPSIYDDLQQSLSSMIVQSPPAQTPTRF